MSALDEFALTIGSSFSTADTMRMLSFGFDIAAAAPSTAAFGGLFTARTLQLIDKSRGLPLIDKSRSLQLI